MDFGGDTETLSPGPKRALEQADAQTESRVGAERGRAGSYHSPGRICVWVN